MPFGHMFLNHFRKTFIGKSKSQLKLIYIKLKLFSFWLTSYYCAVYAFELHNLTHHCSIKFESQDKLQW